MKKKYSRSSLNQMPVSTKVSIAIFFLCLSFGIYMSILNYKYTEIQNIYWGFFGILFLLFIASKIYLIPITLTQLICLTPIILIYLSGWLLIPHTLKFGMFLFSTVCFLYLGTIFIHNRFTKLIFLIAFVISSINITAVLFFISEKSIITREIMNTLFISNAQETKEYLYGKFTFLHLLILLLFILSALFLFFQKKQENMPTPKLNILFTLLFAFSFIISSYSGPLGAISVEYYHYQKYQGILKDMISAREKGMFGTPFTINSSNDGAKKVVVIIGESLNRNYMSLYGYDQATTPNLSRFIKDSTKGKLMLFSDIISPDVTTVLSLRKVLTTINNENQLEFDKSVSVVDLFEKAGYRTYWISNQAPLRDYDTPVAFIGAAADSVIYTTQVDEKDGNINSFKNYYDEELLSLFNGCISNGGTEEKQIFFIHLQGSHFDYKDRYPDKFNVFKSAQTPTENSYLNSVLYNDWVVSEIIKISEANQVDVISYFSDHGEDLKYNHNPENYTKNMSTIPFMVYLSTPYSKANPELLEDLSKNKNTPGMTDNFIHDIQFITGVKSSLYDSTLTFLSDSYERPSKRLVYNNTISYD